eukprot:14807-Heterococcus_DN1.PRE.4
MQCSQQLLYATVLTDCSMANQISTAAIYQLPICILYATTNCYIVIALVLSYEHLWYDINKQ